MSSIGFTEKISTPITVSKERIALIRKTYLLLFIAVIGMIVGGRIGMQSKYILGLFSGWGGWILAMIGLNAIPVIAMRFAYNPTMGSLALFFDGLFAGIILSPMLFIAQYYVGGNIILHASLLTLFVFVVVTLITLTMGETWSPSRNIMLGLFFTVLGGIILSIFIPSTTLSIIVSIGIGAIGVISLTASTSDILNNHQISTPVPGALNLFMGVFMIFQSILSLLMIFGGGGRDE